MGAKVIARGIGLGILAMALAVAIAFAWVWFHSVAIDPGHDGGFYQAYAQRVAPLIAVVAGIPLLLLAGWLSARGSPALLAPLIPAFTYILLDIALIAAGNLWPPYWSLAASYLTKLAAAWAGGVWARRPEPV